MATPIVARQNEICSLPNGQSAVFVPSEAAEVSHVPVEAYAVGQKTRSPRPQVERTERRLRRSKGPRCSMCTPISPPPPTKYGRSAYCVIFFGSVSTTLPVSVVTELLSTLTASVGLEEPGMSPEVALNADEIAEPGRAAANGQLLLFLRLLIEIKKRVRASERHADERLELPFRPPAVGCSSSSAHTSSHRRSAEDVKAPRGRGTRAQTATPSLRLASARTASPARRCSPAESSSASAPAASSRTRTTTR